MTDPLFSPRCGGMRGIFRVGFRFPRSEAESARSRESIGPGHSINRRLCIPEFIDRSPLAALQLPEQTRRPLSRLRVRISILNTVQRTTIDIALDFGDPETDIGAMSNKEIVEDLLQRLPEDTSLRDIAREIEFVAAVREGLAELDRGEGIPIEDIERELPSWIIK